MDRRLKHLYDRHEFFLKGDGTLLSAEELEYFSAIEIADSQLLDFIQQSVDYVDKINSKHFDSILEMEHNRDLAIKKADELQKVTEETQLKSTQLEKLTKKLAESRETEVKAKEELQKKNSFIQKELQEKEIQLIKYERAKFQNRLALGLLIIVSILIALPILPKLIASVVLAFSDPAALATSNLITPGDVAYIEKILYLFIPIFTIAVTQIFGAKNVVTRPGEAEVNS